MALVILLIHHDLDLAALLRLDCALAPRAHHLSPDPWESSHELLQRGEQRRRLILAQIDRLRRATAPGAREGYSKADRLGLTSDGLLSGHISGCTDNAGTAQG